MRRIILGALVFIGALTLAAGIADPMKSNAPFLWTAFFVGLAIAVGSVTQPEPTEAEARDDEHRRFWGL